nr:hypothetical protein [Tanacetum cinerariifolium]
MLDMIPNGVYRAELEVETIINKLREGRLRWFGHVRRRPQSAPVMRVEALVVDGVRIRGRPKLRWEDIVKHDLKELLLSEDMTSNRNEWRARISGLDGSPFVFSCLSMHALVCLLFCLVVACLLWFACLPARFVSCLIVSACACLFCFACPSGPMLLFVPLVLCVVCMYVPFGVLLRLSLGRGHVLRQKKLFQVVIHSILPPKFWSTPSPSAVTYQSFNSTNWCWLWYSPDMSKPPQPSFPHLVDNKVVEVVTTAKLITEVVATVSESVTATSATTVAVPVATITAAPCWSQSPPRWRIQSPVLKIGGNGPRSGHFDNAPNMFSIRIHHGENFQRYPGRMYVSGPVDIFDMVDIDLFTVVALNMMVLKLGYTGESELMFYNYLKPLTSLDEGLYALACEKDVRCLATLVRSFKLIEVIDDMMWQLSFDETELDGEAGFADVAGSGVDIETQSELPVSEEPDVGHTQEPILAEFFYDDEGIDTAYETEYDVQSSEDAGTADDDDDDADQYFLVDEENEIVEHDVDVHLFGISMDLPFDNIGITNLVLDAILEGEDVYVINANGFDSDPSNDEERNYMKRRLVELKTEMKGVINASGQWKRKLKLYKNDNVRLRARCEGKVHVFTMSQGTKPTDLNRGMEAGPSGSSGPTTRSKKRKNTDKFTQNWMVKTYNDTHTCLQSKEIKHCTYKFLSENIFEQVRVNPDILVKAVQDQLQRELEVQISMSKAFRAKAKAEREIRGDLCLGDDIDLHPNSNFTFIDDRQKGWCGQAYKDLLWSAAFATNVRDFEKCMLELKTMIPKAHEWWNKIPTEHWSRSHFLGRAKSDLLLNNICEVFNGKIVRGRDKPVITLLEYIREYCMKRIVNVQGVIDKCIGPLTPTATRITESIKKEAHLIKVKWNGANKYQVSGSLGDQCVVDVVSMTCSCRKWELTWIPCKHDVAACWNMALNDQATPPSETWVGRPKKKRKRSKHEDEPFVKDGKLSRKGRTITCQSCRNTGHNKATCKGQGLFDATGEGGASDPGGAGVASQGYTQLVHDVETSFARLQNHISSMRGYTQLDVETRDYVRIVVGTDDRGKQIGHIIDMPSEAVEQRMDATVPDEIYSAKGEQVPNHVVKKGNLEFLVCKEVTNPGVNELVDKGRPLKRKKVYAE